MASSDFFNGLLGMKTRDIRKFRRVLRQFTRLINAQLKSCCTEVTLAQCLVLLEIDEARTRTPQAPPTMSQLAASLRLDNSTLSRTVEGMVARGLVERIDDESDRRVVKVRLTAEGKDVCRSIHADNDASCRRVFERIPASEQPRVSAAFEVLVQAYLDCEEQDGDGGACG